MQYTKETFQNKEWALKHNGTVQQLNQALDLLIDNNICVALGNADYYHSSSTNSIRTWDGSLTKISPFINVTDFLKIQKKLLFTIQDLTDGKCAVINDGTLKELQLVLKVAFPYDIVVEGVCEVYYRKLNTFLTGDFTTDLPIQSVKDFVKQIDQKKIIMEKEIIGYKVKPEFVETYKKLMGIIVLTKSEGCNFKKNSPREQEAKQYNILDIFCTPVYKAEEETVSLGNFSVTVKGKEVFHGNDNITDFVKEIACYKTSMKLGGYIAQIKEVIFEKTGCQNSETKLSDWLKIYNKIK